jgi:murein DD-endopeptidase MepM/ murein hydrolase activator NlpD
MIFNKAWFSESVNAKTPFGWDAARNRIHPAQDYAPLKHGSIAYTIILGKVSWHIDGQGNSIIRQVSPSGFEVRYYHFRREELTSDIIAAMSVPGTMVEAGSPIGPAGNVGIGTGDHVHLVMVARDDLSVPITPIIGEGWGEDQTEAMALKYGDAFTLKANDWKVKWMNANVIYRFDPMTQRNSYFLNSKRVLGA